MLRLLVKRLLLLPLRRRFLLLLLRFQDNRLVFYILLIWILHLIFAF